MSQYFPKLCESFGRDINVKVDLSNYATKVDIKNVSMLMLKLVNQVFNRLVPIPVDLSKLSDVVKNDVFKKTAYDKLVTRVLILAELF